MFGDWCAYVITATCAAFLWWSVGRRGLLREWKLFCGAGTFFAAAHILARVNDLRYEDPTPWLLACSFLGYVCFAAGFVTLTRHRFDGGFGLRVGLELLAAVAAIAAVMWQFVIDARADEASTWATGAGFLLTDVALVVATGALVAGWPRNRAVQGIFGAGIVAWVGDALIVMDVDNRVIGWWFLLLFPMLAVAVATSDTAALATTPRARDTPYRTAALLGVAAIGVLGPTVGSAAADRPIAGATALLATVGVLALLARLVVLARNLSAERDTLDRLARHDALTGLPNRRQIIDHLRRLADRPRPGAALFFIDLDGFKQINDAYGHVVGDEALVALAARLTEHAGSAGVVGRFAGDEFVVVVDDVAPGDGGAGGAAPTDGPDADLHRASLAASIERVIADPLTLSAGQVSVAASVGWWPIEPGVDPDEVVGLADMAMYERKRASRNSGATRASSRGPISG